MAREIVITSVPRGVRPGRTGFQIAMRTAGLREDVCDQLESLGIYRHLPPGGGPNPVCYFHKFVQTGIGPLQVLGRVADAGADYSSRSNKLAHLIAIEPAELAGLRHSSPAAVLAAVEGRLARTWPGAPEERQQPFGLVGMPAVGQRVCAAWQQATGDAGWGGVLAEQAVRNKPVLVIAPDSSPEWCRRLLDLFAEALALVPEEKRWSVTFDTTILSAGGVLWRGTYAGSPESGARQPGLTVVDLTQRSPVPAEQGGLPLVQVARTGAPAAPAGGPRVPSLPGLPGGRAGKGPTIPPPIDDVPILVPRTTSGLPPVPGGGGRKVGSGLEDEPSNHWQANVAWAVVAIVLLISASIGLVLVFDVPGRWWQSRAKAAINAWADQDDGKQPDGRAEPTADTWLTAFGKADPDAKGDATAGLNSDAVERVLPLLNSALLTKAVTRDTVGSTEQVQSLVTQLGNLRDGRLDAAGLAAIGLIQPQGVEEPAAALIVAWVHELIGEGRLKPDEKQPIQEIQRWMDLLRPLAAVVVQPVDAAHAESIGLREVQSALDFLVAEPAQRQRAVEFAAAIAADPGVVSDAKTVADLRAALAATPAATAVATPSDQPPPRMNAPGADGEKNDPKQADEDRAKAEQERLQRAERQRTAWTEFMKQVESGIAAAEKKPRGWPGSVEPVPLVRTISNAADLDWANLHVILGGVDTAWQPQAERIPEEAAGERGWILRGLPGDDATTPKPWGKVVVRDEPAATKQLLFIAEPDAPWICGFVPIVFAWSAAPDEPRRTEPLRVAGRPQALAWETRGATTWGELVGMAAAGDRADGGGQAAAQAPTVGTLAIPLAPWLAACSPQFVVIATDPAGGSLAVAVHHDEPDKGIDRIFRWDGGTIDIVVQSKKPNLSKHPLVERFRWRVDGKHTDQALAVRVEAAEETPWAGRPGIEVNPTDFNSMKNTRWREIVRSLLAAHLGGEVMNSLSLSEVGKRIGTDKINDLDKRQEVVTGLDEEITKLEDKIKTETNAEDRAKLEASLKRTRQKRDVLGNTTLKKDQEEVTHYGPWSKKLQTDAQPLADWKRMAVEYVSAPGRRFAKQAAAGRRDTEDVKRMAQDPAIVARFLDTKGEWVAKVTQSFADKKVESKAEQNELLALLVLAHLDRMIVAHTDREGVRQALNVPIAECLSATLKVSWTVPGQEAARVPVATVSGGQTKP